MEPADPTPWDMAHDTSIHLARMWRLEQITAIQAKLLGPGYIQLPFPSLLHPPTPLLTRRPEPHQFQLPFRPQYLNLDPEPRLPEDCPSPGSEPRRPEDCPSPGSEPLLPGEAPSPGSEPRLPEDCPYPGSEPRLPEDCARDPLFAPSTL
ncbi:hypothetical protein COCON_G00131950 [Conger conger]|uniref:Uncharacterized protein n=1 Tax=Conger conger TaxID=82655 RepID=A0A9Q1DE43_CONCO|nr:hypothetical protein COCON_G00131950 [Conger conger]